MDEQIQIQILQEDIDRGTPTNPWACPAALALRRQFPDAKSIAVVYRGIYIDDKCYHLTQKLANFMESYDSGKPVKPDTFPVFSIYPSAYYPRVK